MRWRRNRQRATEPDELTKARDHARASLMKARAELARQQEAARQEERTTIGPLRRLVDVNHLADLFAQQLHPGD